MKTERELWQEGAKAQSNLLASIREDFPDADVPLKCGHAIRVPERDLDDEFLAAAQRIVCPPCWKERRKTND
jgi:hypothetical protein